MIVDRYVRVEYDTASLQYEPPYTFDETVVYDLIQNISEERQMINP